VRDAEEASDATLFGRQGIEVTHPGCDNCEMAERQRPQ
jgi:hypothetical protein